MGGDPPRHICLNNSSQHTSVLETAHIRAGRQLPAASRDLPAQGLSKPKDSTFAPPPSHILVNPPLNNTLNWIIFVCFFVSPRLWFTAEVEDKPKVGYFRIRGRGLRLGIHCCKVGPNSAQGEPVHPKKYGAKVLSGPVKTTMFLGFTEIFSCSIGFPAGFGGGGLDISSPESEEEVKVKPFQITV